MSDLQYRVLSMVMGGLLLIAMLVAGRETALCRSVFATGENVASVTDAISTPESGTESNAEFESESEPKSASESDSEGNMVSPEGSKTGTETENGYVVVIDAGHGGDDPGKVGVNGALEKDVNLEIALMVKEFLELNDVKVVLTRDSDEGLYDADASNKKVQDLKRRVEIIEETAPDLVVSIHQNSYPEEYVHGAQVFYYETSTAGKLLAEYIQQELISGLDPDNTRQVKANDSYYLLKKTSVPIVIVECGFLSNYTEAELLCDELYQERLSWAICMGILQYLNQQVL